MSSNNLPKPKIRKIDRARPDGIIFEAYNDFLEQSWVLENLEKYRKEISEGKSKDKRKGLQIVEELIKTQKSKKEKLFQKYQELHTSRGTLSLKMVQGVVFISFNSNEEANQVLEAYKRTYQNGCC